MEIIFKQISSYFSPFLCFYYVKCARKYWLTFSVAKHFRIYVPLRLCVGIIVLILISNRQDQNKHTNLIESLENCFRGSRAVTIWSIMSEIISINHFYVVKLINPIHSLHSTSQLGTMDIKGYYGQVSILWR